MVQPNACKETFLHLSGTMEVSSLSLDMASVEPSDFPKVRTHQSAESGTTDDSSGAGRSAFEIDGVEVIEIYPIDKEETSLVVESNGTQFESVNFTKGTEEEKEFNFGRKMKLQGKVSRFHLLRKKVKRKIPKAKTPVSDASAVTPIKTESVKQRDNVASVLKANEGEAQEVGNEEPSAYEDAGTNGVPFAKEEQLIQGSTENEVIATENKPAPIEVPTAEKESPESKESAATEENKEIDISIEKEDIIAMERNYSREGLSVTMESAPANNEVELMQSSELLRIIKLEEDPTYNGGMPHDIEENLPTESGQEQVAFEIDGVEVIEIYPIDKEETSLVVESNGTQFESVNFTKGTGEEKEFNFGRKMKLQGKVSRFHLLRKKVKRKIPKAKTPVSDASAVTPIKTESVKQRDNVASVLKANEGEAQEVGNEEPSAYEDAGTNGVPFAKEEQLIQGSTENEVIATENKPAPIEVPTAEKESPESKESAATEENKEIDISIEKEDIIAMERNYSREGLSVTMESAPANNEVELMQSSELLRIIKLEEDPTYNGGMPHDIEENLPTESGQEQVAFEIDGVEVIEIYPIDKEETSLVVESNGTQFESVNFTKGTGEEKEFNFGRKMKLQGKVSRFHLLRKKVKRKIPKAKTPVSDASAVTPIKTESVKQRDNVASVLKANEGEAQEVGNEDPSAYEDAGTNGVPFAKEEQLIQGSTENEVIATENKPAPIEVPTAEKESPESKESAATEENKEIDISIEKEDIIAMERNYSREGLSVTMESAPANNEVELMQSSELLGIIKLEEDPTCNGGMPHDIEENLPTESGQEQVAVSKRKPYDILGDVEEIVDKKKVSESTASDVSSILSRAVPASDIEADKPKEVESIEITENIGAADTLNTKDVDVTEAGGEVEEKRDYHRDAKHAALPKAFSVVDPENKLEKRRSSISGLLKSKNFKSLKVGAQSLGESNHRDAKHAALPKAFSVVDPENKLEKRRSSISGLIKSKSFRSLKVGALSLGESNHRDAKHAALPKAFSVVDPENKLEKRRSSISGLLKSKNFKSLKVGAQSLGESNHRDAKHAALPKAFSVVDPENKLEKRRSSISGLLKSKNFKSCKVGALSLGESNHRDAKHAALPKAFSVVDPENKLEKRRSSISGLIKSKSFRSLKVGALSLGKSIKSGHFKSESQKIGLATSAPSIKTDTEQQHVDLDKAAEVQVKPGQTDLNEKRKEEIKKADLTAEGPGDSEGQEAELMSEWSNDQTGAYESTIEDVEATFVQQEAAKDVEPEWLPYTETTEKKQPEAGKNEEGPNDIIQERPSDSSSHENSMRDASLLDEDLSTDADIEEVDQAAGSKPARHFGCCGDMVRGNVPNAAETKMYALIDGCFDGTACGRQLDKVWGRGMKLNNSMDDDSASVLLLDDGDDDDTFHTYDDDSFRDGDTLETADDTLEDVNHAIVILKKHANRLGVTEYELLKKIQEAQAGREQQRKTDPIPPKPTKERKTNHDMFVPVIWIGTIL